MRIYKRAWNKFALTIDCYSNHNMLIFLLSAITKIQLVSCCSRSDLKGHKKKKKFYPTKLYTN